MINNYYVYGLNIRSEIEIDEFHKIDMILEDKVVNIKNGVMPKEIKDDILKGSKIKFSRNRIWFYIPNIATYCIINGSEIIVEVAEGADMQLMKVYLMCSCLGFIMLQRDMVAR